MDPSAGDPRVQTVYTDAAGQVTECSPEAVAGVLRALGDEPDEPLSVVVAWDGVLPAHATHLVSVDDTGQQLTEPLPFGYHSLVRDGVVIGTVISTPRQAPAATPGTWGVMLPLYALRTQSTEGVARYADLGRLFDWLHGHGGQVVLTLPLLPVFLDDPADWSPYSPVSRRLWSELYVDLDAAGAPPAPDAPVPVEGLLDYPAIQHHRIARLDALARELAGCPELLAWLHDNPVAARHARFRGAQARYGRNFRDWPVGREQALADADPVVVARHEVGQWLADTQLAAVSAHARAQGQLLALDVALGVHADGFDVFDEAGLFVEGVSVGAPPDPIFRGGQDWGFPPVHPIRSRRTGHRYIRETLRHHVRHAGLLRIDHVMGLARQWWVPAGLPATAGCYVRYPLEEMFAIAVLEAHLAGAVIVGENLGTVPPEIDHGLHEHRLLGITVTLETLFSYGSDHRRTAPSNSMAMSSTHDTVPFAGFWWGADLDIAHRLGLLGDEERDRQFGWRERMRERVVDHLRGIGLLHDDASPTAVMHAVAELTAAEPAMVSIYALEDLWGETRPQNVPGTFQEEPNWRRVAARTIEELEADAGLGALADRIAAKRRESANVYT